ncbi:MAG: preprotein translocase subunit SecA [Eubacteriales bacterium]|nr:preprotein translocase subunit SecA [Clostridiales bacterium]MDY5836173.1 preprotein translocase subunit SecA [Eubacteriales bacterium]
MSLLRTLFGTSSSREIKKIRPLIQATNHLEDHYAGLSEQDLKAETARFRREIDQGRSLDDLLPEAFATVKEASYRVLGMKHFDVQLIGGIILHQGRIAEMKTGEGKTLVATLPVYLNALPGKGVHVVTVNDYLAKRDSEWMGKVYRYLGMDVGLIVHGKSSQERRASYAADITYGTNNEFGFDYLRDNMVTELDALVQRPLNFAIVDEVDSILIDEARTPLIISGSGEESSENYKLAQDFVSRLKVKVFRQVDTKMDYEESDELEGDADYIVDEKAKTAVLTKKGIRKAESFFKLDNLADQSNYQINHHINNALKANGTMQRDRDYVVQDGEIIIVDDFTGRLMEGRRYSNGLHQAIEAKEGVNVRRESKTLATITFQNYFRMYQKLSGMTGTALTEEDEFKTIYRLDVVTIPTNKPLIRQDLDDAVYKTKEGKLHRLIHDVAEIHATGQPVLVGTVSVESSEYFSNAFRRAGLSHNVLNAKHHAQEAEIISQAGRLGAITIATNMAGRGTDIMLGGNPEHLAKQAMRKEGLSEEIIEEADAYNETDDSEVLKARERFQALKADYALETDKEKAQVIAAGGLCIMGTERHESRRIDNQLRGRAGRQGDPGTSKFYLSLQDDLLRLFGGERLHSLFETLGVEDDMEINHSMLTRAIESAQRKVEGQNFAIRKSVLQYDDVMNQQRELIYRQRRDVLEGKDLHDYYLRTLDNLIADQVHMFLAEGDHTEWDLPALKASLEDLLGDLPILSQLSKGASITLSEFIGQLQAQARQTLEERAAVFGSAEHLREAERYVLLSVVDNHWMDHIDAMDALRDSIGMRAYGQQDPLVAYRKEGFDMFEAMNQAIQEDSIRLIMRAQFYDPEAAKAQTSRKELSSGRKGEGTAVERARDQMNARAAQAAQAGGPKQAPVVKKVMPGRNDPCWCGSGKKYKNCHMQSDRAGQE